VTDEFNQQQLALARATAEQISHHFWMFKKELTLLSLSSEIQESDHTTLARRMQIAFESLAAEGASSIVFLDKAGDAACVIDELGFREERALPANDALLSWARDRDNRGIFYISEVSPPAGDPDWKHMQMSIAMPVWKGLGKNADPATATFSGVLVIVVKCHFGCPAVYGWDQVWKNRICLGHRRQWHIPLPSGEDAYRKKRIRGPQGKETDHLVR